MPKRKNELDRIVAKLAQEYRQQKRRTRETAAVPFGREELAAREVRSRLQVMTTRQRSELLKQPGMREQLMKLIRRQA